jgi:hypothetical protein
VRRTHGFREPAKLPRQALFIGWLRLSSQRRRRTQGPRICWTREPAPAAASSKAGDDVEIPLPASGERGINVNR